MMQPMINPSYFNQYPNYNSQNYYSNPPMSTIQNMGISGRYVNNFEEITANDVPMDGKSALFIKNDLSEIEARAWTPNGMINRIVFKPVIEQKPQNVLPNSEMGQNGAFNDLQSEIRVLSDKIERLMKGVGVYESDSNASGTSESTTVSGKSGK